MKAFKVLLIKIDNDQETLQSQAIAGLTLDLPEKDKNFVIIGESLTAVNERGESTEKADDDGIQAVLMVARVVKTTEVQEIITETAEQFVFKTLSGTYRLDILGTEEVQ